MLYATRSRSAARRPSDEHSTLYKRYTLCLSLPLRRRPLSLDLQLLARVYRAGVYSTNVYSVERTDLELLAAQLLASPERVVAHEEPDLGADRRPRRVPRDDTYKVYSAIYTV